ncbi:G-type lectin S-receptor-like serine/threonine-protein kinase SRK [Rhizophlyctis rosea]|nr:G-type lectin S-receptor-like serine/threonine-protein kinase SRK [Rhizophlyctis rosea]
MPTPSHSRANPEKPSAALNEAIKAGDGARLTADAVIINTGAQSPPYLAKSSLSVQPITLVPAKLEFRRGRRIAAVHDLAFSEDGTVLAVACEDGSVRVWDIREEPAQIRSYHADSLPLDTLLFAHGDSLLVTGSSQNRHISLINLATGELLHSIRFKKADDVNNANAGTRQKEHFNRVGFSAELNSLILANSFRNSLYIFHIRRPVVKTNAQLHPTVDAIKQHASNYDYAQVHFDFVVESPWQDKDNVVDMVLVSDDSNALEARCGVYCVQTKAVQQYTVRAEHAFPSNANHYPVYVSPAELPEPLLKENGIAAGAPGNELEEGELREDARPPDDRNKMKKAPEPEDNIPQRHPTPVRAQTPSAPAERPSSRSKDRSAPTPPPPSKSPSKAPAKVPTDNAALPIARRSGASSERAPAIERRSPSPRKDLRPASKEDVRRSPTPHERPNSPAVVVKDEVASPAAGSSPLQEDRIEALLKRMESMEARLVERLAQETEGKNAVQNQQQHKDLLKNIEQVRKAIPAKAPQGDDDLQQKIGAHVESSFSTQWEKMEKLINSRMQEAMTRPQLVEAVSSSLITSLTAVLEKSFKESFATVLIPRMESAVTTMFAQIHETMESGVREAAFQAHTESFDPSGPLNSSLDALSERINSIRPEEIVGRATGDLQNVIGQTVEKEIRRAFGSSQDMRSASRRWSQHSQPAHETDATMEILSLAESGNYEEAFTRALSSADLPTIIQLCGKVNPKSVFLPDRTLLSQPVILSLMHQISADLDHQTSLKLHWLQELMMNLDKRDPLISEHAKRILPVISRRHSELVMKDPSDPHARTAKMIALMAQGLV